MKTVKLGLGKYYLLLKIWAHGLNICLKVIQPILKRATITDFILCVLNSCKNYTKLIGSLSDAWGEVGGLQTHWKDP